MNKENIEKEKTVIQKNNPLHGVTLKTILETLVEKFGWEGLSEEIRINCFYENPSINSSLKFLRKTEWARKKVEKLYLRIMNESHK
ncbi:MAG: hypothetical protein US83_C0012G0007 [Candidatus Falkowbacteria bacterium GW2011_GWC2_38_22]|uniref:Transporter n=1 Tax=Candidatus Falkowbacteria bacterium GW2011_GWE1_38_31 TaxID=1618638 RepID=A0A0G0MXT5_9BACT|nr:MAG: hypothetical protein US73_C0010G0007 [Candidatus Falkowbacteria bacterium GW2011_GWF2_38_1205]KKQ60768.1 MAG: hypothetical protein US83_C0012G0007 [Candidatus Falkowbacteria bacterium GW2011_GWC2_38_22]KKQ62935.1 MAG: hypothetical protein US84_C0010G0007 [Candidatus Falkowbacteria bacterium GW2011_GWF1_38_22]KKQ64947.1 MAG: hypothetical protein US87_C0010G0007 [Candidatus Falkowbacteria bacterium GW2011_GWE2_38_254]KKQ69711.1 MAG: hypothetical protein US91_C0010G0007 [Candidatus Falkowb